jgi:hypothetical protein
MDRRLRSEPIGRAGRDRCSTRRGRSWGWGLCLACTAWACAAHAETYLVLSLIGDHLTTVIEAPASDNRADANGYEIVPLTGRALDDFVVGTTGAAIEAAAPGAKVTLLRASDPALYASADGWVDVDAAQIQRLVSFVAKAVPATTDARLLLLAPYRAQPSFRIGGGRRGTGSVAGLGFYVGTGTIEGDPVPGYLGVFAHFQLLLIDVPSLAIVSRQPVVVSKAHPASDAPDKTAWNALTMPRKIAALQELTQDEIRRFVPAMVGSRKR